MPRTIHQPVPPEELAREVIHLLVVMSGRLSQHFAARAGEFDLSAGEAKVLLALDRGDTLPMRVLARRLGYDASNLTGIVDKLENRGVVERQTDPTDRRVKAIAATEQGLRLRDNFSHRLHSDAGPVRALTETQLGELHALLKLAIDNPST